MILNLFAKSTANPVPQQLYGAVMAQSRNSAFYTNFGIADTVTGRFDVLSLHMVLLARRLAGERDALAQDLSQAVFDAFTANLDDGLRAIGIGDNSVPKRKKALVHGYYAQIEAFAAALATENADLLAKRAAERFFSGKDGPDAVKMARYMQAAAKRLDAQPLAAFLTGVLEFPAPDLH